MQNDPIIISPNYKNTTFRNGCIRTGVISGLVGGVITLVNKTHFASVNYLGRSINLLWKNLPIASFGVGAVVYLISFVAMHLFVGMSSVRSFSNPDLSELAVNVITGAAANLVVAALTVGTGTAIASSIPVGIFIGVITWGAAAMSSRVLADFKFEKKEPTNWGYEGTLPNLHLCLEKLNVTSGRKRNITNLQKMKYENKKVLIQSDDNEVFDQPGWFDITYHPVCVANKQKILTYIEDNVKDEHEKTQLKNIWQHISPRPLFEF